MSRKTPDAAPAPVDLVRAPSAPPASLATLHALIAQLEAERAGHREALTLFPERERALFERDAPDDDVARLEVQRRRVLFQVEQLNEREHELRHAIAAAELAERQAQWHALLDAYEPIADEIASLALQLHDKTRQLAPLASQAQGVGAAWQTGVTLPWASTDINWQVFAAPAEAVRLARKARVALPAHEQLHNVRFLRFTDMADGRGLGAPAYSTGMEAGFTAAVAHRLVKTGHAVWGDPTRVPPDPRRPARAGAYQR